MTHFSPYRTHRIWLCIAFLISAGSIFGSGQSDSELRKAEQLIDARQYNDAILVLTKLMKDKPEYLSEAEDLLKRIRMLRNEYNDLYQRLITVLYEKQDVDEALMIISRLESLDIGPNAAYENAIAKAKDMAELVSGLNKFNRIMSAASDLINRRKFRETLPIYQSGLMINRGSFENTVGDTFTRERVFSSVKSVEAGISEVMALQSRYGELPEMLRNQVTAGTLSGEPDTVSSVIELLEQITATGNKMKAAAVSFDSLNTMIAGGQNGKEDLYLSILTRLLYGRTASHNAEGILFILKQLFSSELDTLLTILEQASAASYNEARNMIATGRPEDADSAFSRAELLYSLMRKIGKLDGEPSGTAGFTGASAWGDYADSSVMTRLLYAWLYELISGNYRKYLTGLKTDGQTASRPDIEKRYAFWTDVIASWEKDVAAAGELPDGFMRTSAGQEISALSALLSAVQAGARDDEIRFVVSELSSAVTSGSSRLNGLESRTLAAIDLMNGLSETGRDGSVIVKRYPDRTVESLSVVETAIAALSREIGAVETRFASEKTYIRNNSGFQDLDVRVAVLRKNLTELSSMISSGRNSALGMIQQAKKYRQEGDLRFREAEAAIQKEEFETARQKIIRAQDTFLMSLSSQESQELRLYMDREVLRLSEKITQAENTTIVREVRRAITEGKNLYLQGVYDKAEDSLLKAQARWSQTNSEKNSEIEYWLGFVKSALNIKSSREIPETHSLYNEMRQLLNLAHESFDKGKRLLESGDKAGSNRYFDEAEAKVLQVKIPFPFNKDANILPLQILKLRDPVRFRSVFGERFKLARDLIRMNPDEALMNLQDLEEVDPSYPGLKAALYDVKVLKKIIIPPPDRKAITESETLYQIALNIYTQNNKAQFQIAVERLTRAIELNPDNSKAIELKDKIQMSTGGQLSLVLSSADQQEYKNAEEKFISGKYIEAKAIVDRLLKKGNNNRYQPLIQLKGLIESKI